MNHQFRQLFWLQFACSLVIVCSWTTDIISHRRRLLRQHQQHWKTPKLSSSPGIGRTNFYLQSHNSPLEVQASSSSSSLDNMASIDDKEGPKIGFDRSLAGDYMLSINDDSNDLLTWSLYKIDDVSVGQDILAEGARATYSLLQAESISSFEPDVVITLSSSNENNNNNNILEVSRSRRNKIETDDDDVVDEGLMRVLERVMVQWAVRNNHLKDSQHSNNEEHNKICSIMLSESKDDAKLIRDITSEEGAIELFADMLDQGTAVEWVEMVTGNGIGLGRVPRKLVHSYNLLHRGIGLFVSRDSPMPLSSSSVGGDDDDNFFPDLYVHRRAADKRIFPSLYDMFVGGVSLADEEPELTARREVAEELGLTRAIEDDDDDALLEGPILNCVVCTAYNRCFVTLFSYVMDTTKETVHWQEEEVDWGEFVPYSVIVAAADRSIQRFADKRTWPGSYPPIQSSNNGELQFNASTSMVDWKDWDFVPDGLLVWESWLKMIGAERK